MILNYNGATDFHQIHQTHGFKNYSLKMVKQSSNVENLLYLFFMTTQIHQYLHQTHVTYYNLYKDKIKFTVWIRNTSDSVSQLKILSSATRGQIKYTKPIWRQYCKCITRENRKNICKNVQNVSPTAGQSTGQVLNITDFTSIHSRDYLNCHNGCLFPLHT